MIKMMMIIMRKIKKKSHVFLKNKILCLHLLHVYNAIMYIVWFVLGLFLLQACHSPHQLELPIGPSNNQKHCLMQCTHQVRFCNKICFKNCTNCCANSQLRAREFLNRYKNQSKITGQIAFSSLQSFDDPLKCNKNSCDCQADYLLCKQHCLDKIQKRLKIYKFC